MMEDPIHPRPKRRRSYSPPSSPALTSPLDHIVTKRRRLFSDRLGRDEVGSRAATSAPQAQQIQQSNGTESDGNLAGSVGGGSGMEGDYAYLPTGRVIQRRRRMVAPRRSTGAHQQDLHHQSVPPQGLVSSHTELQNNQAESSQSASSRHHARYSTGTINELNRQSSLPAINGDLTNLRTNGTRQDSESAQDLQQIQRPRLESWDTVQRIARAAGALSRLGMGEGSVEEDVGRNGSVPEGIVGAGRLDGSNSGATYGGNNAEVLGGMPDGEENQYTRRNALLHSLHLARLRSPATNPPTSQSLISPTITTVRGRSRSENPFDTSPPFVHNNNINGNYHILASRTRGRGDSSPLGVGNGSGLVMGMNGAQERGGENGTSNTVPMIQMGMGLGNGMITPEGMEERSDPMSTGMMVRGMDDGRLGPQELGGGQGQARYPYLHTKRRADEGEEDMDMESDESLSNDHEQRGGAGGSGFRQGTASADDATRWRDRSQGNVNQPSGNEGSNLLNDTGQGSWGVRTRTITGDSDSTTGTSAMSVNGYGNRNGNDVTIPSSPVDESGPGNGYGWTASSPASTPGMDQSPAPSSRYRSQTNNQSDNITHTNTTNRHNIQIRPHPSRPSPQRHPDQNHLYQRSVTVNPGAGVGTGFRGTAMPALALTGQEAEETRRRYEETNRMLGSLVLSRMRMEGGDGGGHGGSEEGMEGHNGMQD